MPLAQLTIVLKTKELFAKNHQGWSHVVWTNDKKLIPLTVQALEQNGIKVQELSETSKHFILRNKIDQYIEQARWGMASNCVRYEVIKYFGGIYADLNYVFVRDVEDEIHKHDYFSHEWDRDPRGFFINAAFFGAIPHHPVIEELVDLVYRNLYYPPVHISIMQEKGNSDYTDEVTASPTALAYYRAAHKNGTIDVIYPYISQNQLNMGSIIYDKNDVATETVLQDNFINEMQKVLFKYPDCQREFEFF